MRPTDDELRDLWRSATAASPAEHPDADELERAARGELPPADRERVADHLVECGDCAALVRRLGDLQRWADAAASEVSARGAAAVSGTEHHRRWRPVLGLAAALVLATLAGLAIWQLAPVPGGKPPDALRSSAPAAVRPISGATLSEPPSHLAWPAQPGAAAYRVVLYDERAEVLWRGPAVRGTELDLPPDAAALLRPGHSYSWSVRLEDGASGRELGPYWFRVEEGG